MPSTDFDAFTQQVGTIDRKTSLKLLGGILATTAATLPMTGEAKKKSCGKKVKRQVAKTCSRQVEPCQNHFRKLCGTNQLCLDSTLPCCAFLDDCDATGHYLCLESIN